MALTEESNVTIKVFDILGEEVRTLISEKQEAGIYEVEFSTNGGGSNLVSGIYFLRLNTENYTGLVKMVFVK